MQREEIRASLKNILQEEMGETLPDLPDGANLAEQFQFDSVDVVSLVMQIERQFRIRVREDELADMETVGSLITLVQAKLSEPRAAAA